MRRLGVVVMLSLLAASVAEAETSARLLVRGPYAPGAEIDIQVELSWDGRPEAMLPQVPSVEVPEGAALRLGSTGSRFDGDRTVWWTDGAVTLPDTDGPWVIGPATIPVATRGGEAEHVAEARTLGRGRRRSLLGQGVASGSVLALALLALGVGWRRLLREEEGPDPIDEAAQSLRAALAGGRAEDALVAGLALHDALSGHRVARDYLGPRADLERRREEIRFGGEAADVAAVQSAVAPLLAIAGALE